MRIGGNRARGELWLLGLLLPLTLAGCASGPAPRDHYYRLEAGAPAASRAEPPLAGVVEVGRPRSDALTGQLAILYTVSGESEIHRHAYHRWADSPTTMVQNELADFLRAAGAAEQVVKPAMRVEADFAVAGHIARLERALADDAARVVVEMELSVTRKGGELLLLESYREERTAGGSRVADAVTAFGEALTGIFERFVADLDAVAAAPAGS